MSRRPSGRTRRPRSGGDDGAECWRFAAPPSELGTEVRQVSVHADRPRAGIGPDTGLMVIQLGYATDPAGPFFRKLRRAFADRYDCVCIGVAYLGTAAAGRRTLSVAHLDLAGVLSLLPPHVARGLLAGGAPELGQVLVACRGHDLQDHLVVQETLAALGPEDYLDYGPGQALDLILATRAAVARYGLREDRVYFFGSSLAGFLAHLVLKLAPATYALVVDVSGPALIPAGRFFTGGQAPALLDGFNTTATLSCHNLYVEEPGDPRSLTPARWELRDTTHPAHLRPSPTVIRSLHGVLDRVVDLASKELQRDAYLGAGRDAELEVVGPGEVDGRVFKHAGHALGANFHGLLGRYADRWCDPASPEHVTRPGGGDRGAVYALPVTGGTWVMDHSGDRPDLSFRSQRCTSA